jgi:hypothetical protein
MVEPVVDPAQVGQVGLLELSPTVTDVAGELAGASVTAQQLCEAVLRRHDEYGDDAARATTVAWPPRALRQPTGRWLEAIRRLYRPGAHTPLHGRVVILGAALVDRYSGRALLESGLFALLAGELRTPLLEDLSDEGRRAIAALPLAATVAGAAPERTLTVPDDGLSGRLQVRDVALTSDGSVVTGVDAGIIVFSPSGQPVALVRPEEEPPPVLDEVSAAVAHLHARRDPDTLAATADLRVRVLREPNSGSVVVDNAGTTVLATGRADGVLAGQSVVAAAIDPDGEVVALADAKGMITVWRGGESLGLAGLALGTKLEWLSLAPGATRLAVGARSQALVGDVREGGTPTPVGGPGATCVAWSPDGELLAVASTSGELALWHVGTWRMVGVVRHRSPLSSVAFSPDGQQVVAGGEGSAAVWPVGLPRRRTVATYTPDMVTGGGEDLIGVKGDVEALATLIAARTLVPPLSIAVFGDWGAGKTFFLRRLRDEVATIAAEARASGQLQRDIEFYKYIAQVEFNAWQYVEGNLWASLVEHILSNLYVDLDPEAEQEERERADARTEKLLGEERQRLAQASAAVAEAGGLLEQLSNETADLRQRHQERLVRLQQAVARDALDAALDQQTASAVQSALAPLGMQDLSRSARDLTAAVASGRRELDALLPVLRTTGQHDPQARRLRRRLVTAAMAGPLTALGVAAVSWALGAQGIAAFTGLAAGAAAAARWLTTWFRDQTAWVASLRANVEEASARLQGSIDQVRKQQAVELAEHQQELSRLNAELNAKLHAEEQARQRVAALEARQRRPVTAVLARYIEDRVASDDYRRYLGVPALVHQDFERISRLIEESTRQLAKNDDLAREDAEAHDRLDRIVLYIDDLDRCPPRRVVEVLEAVHLLLAFPLFVVVVGVDSRWVLRSLEAHYRQLLAPGEDGEELAATPLDYVEKIFQVPYQLRPLDTAGTQRMLRGLLQEVELGGEAEPAVDFGTRPWPGPSPAAPRPAAGARDGSGPAAAGDGHRAAPRDMAPDGLRVEPDERRGMREVAALIGTTPRTVKRFMNLYRIIKVRALDRRERFLERRGPWADFEILQLLLAISTGLPRLAPPLFQALVRGRGQPLDSVLAALDDEDGDLAEDRGRLRSWLREQPGERWAPVPADRLRPWIDDVRRFSFIIHAPDQHQGDEGEPPPAAGGSPGPKARRAQKPGRGR